MADSSCPEKETLLYCGINGSFLADILLQYSLENKINQSNIRILRVTKIGIIESRTYIFFPQKTSSDKLYFFPYFSSLLKFNTGYNISADII